MITFQENISLVLYTTFGIDAKAKFFVEIEGLEDILALQDDPLWQQLPHLFLGSGANILFTKDYEGIVVKISLKGKKIIKDTPNFVEISVGAGEDWNEFVLRTTQQGWGGLENLVGIPSSVGAAAVGNIGAYGIEAKDRIVSVQGINLSTNQQETLSLSDCKFGYRESIFKHELKDSFIITAVCFCLEKFGPKYHFATNYRELQSALVNIKGKLSLETLANLIADIRTSKLPDWHKLGTAGSFFKNPVVSLELFEHLRQQYPNLVSFNIPGDSSHLKLSAGQLIELVGMKGYRQGNVGVYEKHALILVNYGGAKGEEIVNLAEYIQSKVLKMFGVALDPEVIYI